MVLTMPCEDIEIDGITYNSFVDGYSIVLTTEEIGEIASFDKSKDNYFNVARIVDLSRVNYIGKYNINNIISIAKSKGYKYKKLEIGNSLEFKYVCKIKDAYIKIGILDQAYSIINDGEDAEVYYINSKSPIYIKTSIGICLILPFHYCGDGAIDKIVIEL